MMLVNGAATESIPAADRGMAYGDGVFRTLRALDGEPLHWRKQFNKLADDCARMNIPCPPSTVLLSEARTVAHSHSHAVVKITVTRGSGARGYAPPAPSTPLRVVTGARFEPLAAAADGVTARVCNLRLGHQPALAGVKHLNRLENVLARAEWRHSDIHEGLMLDQQGLVIGGTMTNLFMVEGGRLYTPLLDQCGIAGVTRSRLMALAQHLVIPCHSEALPLERVLAADEVFFCNSLIGLWPLVRLDQYRWKIGPKTQILQQALNNEDAALV